MAITIVQERKKQRYLISVLALIIFAILAVIWFGFFREESVSLPSVPTVIYVLPEVEIDWQMLEDLRSQPAYSFQEISTFEGSFGRDNPFIPY